MSDCADCGIRLKIDERISHQGKIVCGHCFVKMPVSQTIVKKEKEDVVFDKDKAILELMEIVVNLDERIKNLEDKLTELCNMKVN